VSVSKGRCNINNDRRYPARPILGVGAIIFDKSNLLIVERGREPLKGFWSLPGGVVETGELLAAAIAREVMEETGLVVEPASTFEIFERIIRDEAGRAEYHYVLVDYLCRVTGGSLIPGDDVTQAAWVSQQELAGYRLTDGTLEVIERAFLKHEDHKR
jgi:8-oxo-dGTP diphosphatase